MVRIVLASALMLTSLGACSGERTGEGAKQPGAASAGPDEAEAEFWKALEIDGNWVEFHASLPVLTAASDLVVVAELTAIEAGPSIQGDAVEDVVSHAVLRAHVVELLRGRAPGDQIELQLVLPEVLRPADLAPTVARMNRTLPRGSVLLMLRTRGDAPEWRPVNGYGIWAQTPRAQIDSPLNPQPPNEDIYGAELAELADFQRFVDAIRGYARN